jgi:hypothetical protein
MATGYRFYTDEGALLRGPFEDGDLKGPFEQLTPEGWSPGTVPGEHAVEATVEAAQAQADRIAGEGAELGTVES